LSSTLGALLGSRGKRVIGAFTERVWLAGFTASSLFVRPRPLSWTDGPPRPRVLVVAPHPDDESIGGAGAMLLHRRVGAEVVVACVTDGRTSRAMELGPDEMARRRRAEAGEAARRLGITQLEWLGLPAGRWADENLQHALGELLRVHRPDVVYAPSCVDFHPEHTRVAHVLARALCTLAAKPPVVRIYPVQVPLTPRLANLVVDVTACIDGIRGAFDAYETQRANMPRALRQRRYAAHCYRAGEHAEEFWQLTADEYAAVHDAPALASPSPFRGVREHPATDPLAYMLGTGARRRLASRLRVSR
jgi:LmbE family N-acetylglucosaminyl deacetylase